MKVLRNFYMLSIFIFLYFPIVILITFSFNNSAFSWVWHGFTWHWYIDLFSDAHLWVAAWHSLLLGFTAALSATAVSALAAICLRRKKSLSRHFFQGSLLILILAPDIVLGISLLLIFSVVQLRLGFLSLILAHITFCIPFAVATIYSRLATLENSIFEAAIDLGASETVLFFRVMLPLLWPAIIASFLLCFTLSIDDVIVSYFVSGPDFEILPLKIYSLVHAGVKPELNALCSIILIVTLTFVVISQLMLRKKR